MRWTRVGLVCFVVGAAALLLVAIVLGFPVSVAAQRSPEPAGAPLPEGHVGSETCQGCHEDAYNRFATTKMGRLFLRHPRNTLERLGCESCHGPGKAHADQGGGKGRDAKLITFAKNDPTPVERRNETCLTCHTKGNRVFWKGSPHDGRDVACTSCHRIMQDHSPRAQLAKATEIETCGTCHIQKRAQQMRSSHMPLREGKMTCTSCHNPHGTVTPALLKENSTND